MKKSISVLILLFVLCGSAHAKKYNLLLADHTQKMLFIRSADGNIVWKHPSASLFEAWVLEDGSIVYSTGTTVEKIIPDLKEGKGGTPVWSYRYGTDASSAPLPKGTIYTCTPVRDGNFLVTESGTFRLVEINSAGKIAHTISLPRPREESSNSLRLTRHTPRDTFLVPYFGEGNVIELDISGKQVGKVNIGQHCKTQENSAYEAIPLEGDRLLVSCGPQNRVIILNADGAVDWKLTDEDLPSDINFCWITKVIPLKNGNIIICNYCKGKAKTKAFEITPSKEIVWQLRDARIKGLTTLQLLTDDYKPSHDELRQPVTQVGLVDP